MSEALVHHCTKGRARKDLRKIKGLVGQSECLPVSTEPCLQASASQCVINPCGSAVCNPNVQEMETKGQFKIIQSHRVRVRPSLNLDGWGNNTVFYLAQDLSEFRALCDSINPG